MKRILLSLLLVVLTVAPASAQDDEAPAPPTFVVSSHQCDYAQLDTLIAQDRARTLPILQALVDEGKLIQAGEAVHHWGDEYNLLTWLAAPDMPSALAAWEDMTARYREAYPDDNLFIETCPKHRDYFYTQRVSTQAAAPPPNGGNGLTLAVSYYTCDYPQLGALLDEARTRGLPIAQGLVDEGALGHQGIYTHDWGDEWNFVITRTAADLPTLLRALETFGERYAAEYGTNTRSLLDDHCSAHKDNIYTVRMLTN